MEKIPNQPEFESFTRTQILIAMGGTALLLLVIAKVVSFFGDFYILPVEITTLGIIQGLAIGVGITGASAILYRLWPAYSRSADIYLKLILTPLIWPDLIWLGLLPGLSEELLFRGVIFAAIGLNPLGLVVSSIFFGLLHFSGSQQWPYIIWATLVGVILGYSALATGNLVVPIVAHIFTNFISGFLWKFKYIGSSHT
ncbi:MAG: CPBP family intramembrane metalloprotease [Limnospira sp. PMC 1279.21]|uniref:Abortive infection protein n=3 Tax=Limnospira TaxID=2596745 RepID=A0A9P1KB51_9CYAN|nr:MULTISPECIES: CPBP family intramembrane glutamic endopeptidase [Limnospira]EKD10062.1 Abortive infection protein [Arthrospira platensis C1]MDC0837936.1 CPBP family intramembrane metalloprotease [Limnoraphis robusta]MDY7051156.1 CPBP family intramembrane glutamic endopeptidase [Limnospira fusiformis LS22]QJB28496.1 CPBP family intramembrane metalloprotease [Limnospira fusiformis SAG 85.79]RAQ44258.1 CPBP family intramembrane metalloprotease [Arthrospira sp. O9.13F]